MGISDKVLRDKVSNVIRQLEQPVDVECKAHASLAEGVKVLLEIQRAILDGKIDPGNSISIGPLTFTGTFAVLFGMGVYCVMKVHGLI